jgi:predicted nucleic acid-binding protein
MVLVDTNVLIDFFQDDPQWADWSIARRTSSSVHMRRSRGGRY